MTVAELIAELEKHDPNLEVLMPGHPDGGGYDDVWDVQSVRYNPKGIPCSYAGYYDPDKNGVEGLLIL